MSQIASQGEGPPECLLVLGLRPPVSVEDVRQAYLEKVKTAHPDHGGDPAKFKQLQEAFDQATEYARFKSSRAKWLGEWVDQYADQQRILDELRALGAQVDVQSVDWVTQTIGPDFATVLDRVTSIRLEGPAITDETLAHMAVHRRVLAELRRFELLRTAVKSQGLAVVGECTYLEHLDLSGTQVDAETLGAVLTKLERLKSLVLHDTGVGWWARTRLGLAHRQVQITG